MDHRKCSDYRIWNAATIDELYYEPENNSRNHKRVHATLIEPLLGITENTTLNYRRAIRSQKRAIKKPAGYIVATLQMLGPLQTCAQIGIKMPQSGRLTIEYLAEYFTKARIEELKFEEQSKNLKKKLPMK